MGKRTIQVTFKIDFITDEEWFLEGFDEASNEEIRECFSEGIEDRLSVQYDGVTMKAHEFEVTKVE